MASATPFGGGNQPIFQKYLAGFGPGSPFMPARIYGQGGGMGPVGAGGGAGRGAIPGTYDPATGGIPETTPTSTSLQTLLASIGGNLSGLQNTITGITGAENKALRDQYPASYFDTLGTLMGNVANRAQGNIEDLTAGLGQYAGEWGIGRGVAGGPAANTNLLASLGLTKYGVQRGAIEDQGRIQNLIPKVAPFDAARLIPDYGAQAANDLERNIFGSAPIPAAAAARAEALARAGLNRGFGAGGGGFNWFNPMGAPRISPSGPTRPTQFGFNNPGVPNPVGPGWGVATPGQVPMGPLPPGVAGLPGGQGVPFQDGPAYFDTIPNLWDTPFDMPQDFGGWDFDEEFF